MFMSVRYLRAYIARMGRITDASRLAKEAEVREKSLYLYPNSKRAMRGKKKHWHRQTFAQAKWLRFVLLKIKKEEAEKNRRRKPNEIEHLRPRGAIHMLEKHFCGPYKRF